MLDTGDAGLGVALGEQTVVAVYTVWTRWYDAVSEVSEFSYLKGTFYWTAKIVRQAEFISEFRKSALKKSGRSCPVFLVAETLTIRRIAARVKPEMELARYILGNVIAQVERNLGNVKGG